MAYHEGLTRRIREVLPAQLGLDEQKMFGGLAFLFNGHMGCGIVGGALLVRVGPEHPPAALAHPHARAMDFAGRPMKGMVYVAPPGFESDEDLQSWVEMGLRFVQTLPPKPPKSKKTK